mmetsp:Transcript_54248/g.99251  ORF Transcript_54248/g.99251 Transcript_54248/m.99251 type:complete len:92 (-) Transcript_54248:2-277(-)
MRIIGSTEPTESGMARQASTRGVWPEQADLSQSPWHLTSNEFIVGVKLSSTSASDKAVIPPSPARVTLLGLALLVRKRTELPIVALKKQAA